LPQEKIEHELPVGGLEGFLKIVGQLVLSTIRDVEKDATFLVGFQFVENFLAEIPKISEVQDGIWMFFVLTHTLHSVHWSIQRLPLTQRLLLIQRRFPTQILLFHDLAPSRFQIAFHRIAGQTRYDSLEVFGKAVVGDTAELCFDISAFDRNISGRFPDWLRWTLHLEVSQRALWKHRSYSQVAQYDS
jgi:hypothetical protein